MIFSCHPLAAYVFGGPLASRVGSFSRLAPKAPPGGPGELPPGAAGTFPVQGKGGRHFLVCTGRYQVDGAT